MRRSGVALLLSSALWTAPALAADTAKTFFQVGAQAYDAGRFEAAAEAFDEAYRLAPLPAILFSMAQAERKQFYVGRARQYLDRAIGHFRTYVEAKTATRRAEAADALAELEAVASRLSPRAEPAAPEPPRATKARLMVTTQAASARIAIDEQPPLDAPFIGELSPGRHRVRVTAEGFFPEERAVELAPGPPAALDLPLKERAGQLSIEAPSGTEIHVDGKLVGEAPLAAPVELPSGPHAVTLTRRGLQSWSGEVTLLRGKAAGVAPAMESTGQRTISYAVLGAGAAALLAGGVCTAVAFDRQGVAQRVLDEKAKGNIAASRLSYYDLAGRQRDQWRTAAEVTYGAGAGILAVGALLWLLDRPAIAPAVAPRPASSPPPGSPVEVSAMPSAMPGGVGIVAVGRY